MTEYGWEQVRADREAVVRHGLVCGDLAERDRQSYEVRYECGGWDEFRALAAKLKAEGWREAEYGQVGSLYFRSGYFLRGLDFQI